MYINFDVGVLILCFLISLLTTYRKEQPKYLSSFPYFLGFTVLIELIGTWMKFHNTRNTLLYNFFSIIEFIFYSHYFFKRTLNGRKLKIAIDRIAFIFPFIVISNMAFLQGFKNFHTYTYILQCLLIDIYCITYFYQQFNTQVRVTFQRTPSFWITSGLLFFYISSMAYFGVLNYVSSLPKSISRGLITLMHFSDGLLYVLFIIAFTCRINFRKSM
jgi:hypothetical protein